MRHYFIALLALGLYSCGCNPVYIAGPSGVAGVDGKDGATGPAGSDGSPGEAGTDGAPGADGQDGIPGVDGQDATPITMIKLCPGDSVYPTTFTEYAFCVGGKLYGTYSANGGFTTYLPPGDYASNAINSACNFTVEADCQIVN